MQFDDSLMVMRQRIEDGNLGIAAAPIDPMRIQAELHIFWIGGGQHVVEFSSALPEFRVVVVVGQHHVELARTPDHDLPGVREREFASLILSRDEP